jgi:hypothetical protein
MHSAPMKDNFGSFQCVSMHNTRMWGPELFTLERFLSVKHLSLGSGSRALAIDKNVSPNTGQYEGEVPPLSLSTSHISSPSVCGV